MIVVDSSALVQALLHAGSARRAIGPASLHAPHLIDPEVLGTLRGHVLGHKLQPAQAERAVRGLGLIDLARHAAVPLAARV